MRSLFGTMRVCGLLVAAAIAASATPCGTVASPTACSVTVGAGITTTFTATDFAFLNSAHTGGGALYQAEDINIDIASGGGRTALLSFSKNSAGPTPGVVFLANPGDASAFTFSYSLTISPDGPGTVDYSSLTVSLPLVSHLGNGLGSDQTIVSPTSCQATTTTPSLFCVLPGGAGTTISVGQIISLTGNTGNVGLGTFANLFDTTFSAAAATPEPSSFAFLGFGLIAFRLIRR